LVLAIHLKKSITIAMFGQQVQPAIADVNAELRKGKKLHKHPQQLTNSKFKKLPTTTAHTQLKKLKSALPIQLK
jgi:hypothetical protein